RFFAHEAVPGQLSEPVGVDPMRRRLNRQLSIADDPNQRRDRHELDQAQVVDFRDQQLLDAFEEPWTASFGFGAQEDLESAALAIMSISQAAFREQFLIGREERDRVAQLTTLSRRNYGAGGTPVLSRESAALELANECEQAFDHAIGQVDDHTRV